MMIYKQRLLTTLVLSISLACYATPVLHRAYEPARVNLDILLEKQSLSVLVNLDSESIASLRKELSLDEFIAILTASNPISIPTQAAQCQLKHQQFLPQPTDNPPYTYGITGYLTYQCANPDALDQLSIQLWAILPQLKEISVWIVTDNWQGKQVLRGGNQKLKLGGPR